MMRRFPGWTSLLTLARISPPWLGFREDDPKGILTNNHERVRSKSEKILTDLFFSKNIFYKYECPLHLADNLVFYPDFTFFLPQENREIYWEHFGLMDSPDYAINTIKNSHL